MKLLQQPGDGVAPLVNALNNAKSSIAILIFRFDQLEIERALASAVSRGVAVRALIAHVNGSGAERLRKLEMRLLAKGVTVARTDDNLVRYHAKLIVIDERELYVLAFNFTNQDINRSRSFGLIVDDKKLVQEALKLFDADMKRQPYETGLPGFVVSPENAREQLSSFIEGAQKELLIYDPKVSDPAILRLLTDRSKAGVDIKIIGLVSPTKSRLASRRLTNMRLHTRCMVRDGEAAFLGSQSLRKMELDSRREVGLIFKDETIVQQIAKTFREDWEQSRSVSVNQIDQLDSDSQTAAPAAKVAKKVAKAVTKDLPPIAPVVDLTIKELVGAEASLGMGAEEIEEAVRDAVKEAVKDAVRDVVEESGQSLVKA